MDNSSYVGRMRDGIARDVLRALLEQAVNQRQPNPQQMAEQAYEIADAMLAVRRGQK